MATDGSIKPFWHRVNITVAVPVEGDEVVVPRVAEILRGYLLSLETGQVGNRALEAMKIGDVWPHIQAENVRRVLRSPEQQSLEPVTL